MVRSIAHGFFVCLLLATSVQAIVMTVNKGDALDFDPASIPVKLKSNHAILQAKCRKCHSLERVVVAIRSRIAPISGGVFDHNSVKSYGIKMLRKHDSGMTKNDVKMVMELLDRLIDESAK